MSARPAIKPAGIGDLKVIRQRLARYEAGEIAHIENLMASEKRDRQHRRLRRMEEQLTEEVERTEESLRDLQSTERFELEQETKSTQKEESKFEAGAEISAGYGPVSVNAFAKTATEDSREEADRNASKYAKELTERTVSRLEERVRRERISKTLEEVEEINEHGFEPSPDHNVGIYRWVDKYYRLKVETCGKRLWFEFFVPEPSAFYVFAHDQYQRHNALLREPVEPTVPAEDDPELRVPLSPDLITRDNYMGLLQNYGVEGAKPPPPAEIAVTQTISKEFSEGEALFATSTNDLELPKGYVPAFAQCKVDVFTQTSFLLGVLCDGMTLRPAIRWSGDPARITSGGGLFLSRRERDVVPISVSGWAGGSIIDAVAAAVGGEASQPDYSWGSTAFAAHVTVTAVLADEAWEDWQLQTFNAVMAAYRKQQLEYREGLAAAEIQEGVQIEGRNPAANREIERQELKRACLQMWLGVSEFVPSAVSDPDVLEGEADRYPEIDFASALSNADSERFFEGAFEWENMTYEMLPYYWGRKGGWIDDLAIDTPDPVFGEFLKAGAARVRIPVTPASTEAVLWYQLSGEIWTGGPIPNLESIDDPDAALYQSYLNELAPFIEAAEEVDGTPIPDVADEMEIDAATEETFLTKVPTSLVWLQQDDYLLPNLESP